ncbi:MAG: 3-phosphoshikimate 1-carboxyvinyltransferase [Eubacteriales bacterium]|nr:3-phosphoshikimate 1-carboxyvinyltransferase [Eubacteriales bacterium]
MKFENYTSPLRGEISVPGDKSISHRAVMFGALADGTTEVTNFLQGADCLSTISCFRKMGIEIENTPEHILIHGKGLHGLKKPSEILDTGNSGTTTRLISGILAGQSFQSVLNGDASIQSRPMKRIMDPLSLMGADIVSMKENGCAPLMINGNSSEKHVLHGIHYLSPVASAQVKSCILLAGLYADSPVSVTEPELSRNHTELMLSGFGADIHSENTTATIVPDPKLTAMKIAVPGDISSAAYFIAAALMVPGSEILIRNVGINPTRDGILRVAKQMGADITLLNEKISGGEPTADILVKYSPLQGIEIGGKLIPSLIDELPVIAVLACTAKGTTVIKDAQELKVKESNRIDTVANALEAMGAHVQATDDGMIIEGGYPLNGAVIDSHKDHRIAMSFAIASLIAKSETEIIDADCVKISYPNFYETLNLLKK